MSPDLFLKVINENLTVEFDGNSSKKKNLKTMSWLINR